MDKKGILKKFTVKNVCELLISKIWGWWPVTYLMQLFFNKKELLVYLPPVAPKSGTMSANTIQKSKPIKNQYFFRILVSLCLPILDCLLSNNL